MNMFKSAEKLMTMDEKAWARHSNPMSVYTRFSCLPLLSLAIWSREYLGLWSLIPISLSLFWIWYNPRAFPPPTSTNNWASKGTFGERIFLRRKKLTIPGHHIRMAYILSVLAGLGLPALIYGLYTNQLLLIALGNMVTIYPKVWFVDRMVWIYEDMKDTEPEFREWLKP